MQSKTMGAVEDCTYDPPFFTETHKGALENRGSSVADHFGYQGDVMIAAACHLRIPVDDHFRFLNFRFWWFDG